MSAATFCRVCSIGLFFKDGETDPGQPGHLLWKYQVCQNHYDILVKPIEDQPEDYIRGKLMLEDQKIAKARFPDLYRGG